jgi:alkyl hydroperoxide reductase subunit AhpC
MNFENDKIKRIQSQIDSMRTMRAQLDYLNNKIDKKIKNESADKLPKYFIIADAFLEISKAQNLLTQLKNIGYNDARVINDKTNAWYLVAYAEVGNEEQADEILKKIRAYQNPSAWIYTNK